MTDTKRTILAGLVIGLLTLAIPFYLQLIGVVPEDQSIVAEEKISHDFSPVENKESPLVVKTNKPSSSSFLKSKQQSFFIITDKYNAQISNLSGGSIVNFKMHSFEKDGYKYLGGYDDQGNYLKDINLSLSIATSRS